MTIYPVSHVLPGEDPSDGKGSPGEIGSAQWAGI